MNSPDSVHIVFNELKRFKRKYFFNKLIKGLLLLLLSLIVISLIIGILEYFLWFNENTRFILVLLGSITSVSLIIYYFVLPAYHLSISNKLLSDEEASSYIGKNNKQINDKLLNIIQLYNTKQKNDRSLLLAGIDQKIKGINTLEFANQIAIFQNNRKYFIYSSIAAAFILGVLLFSPKVLTESSYRLIHFNTEFIPPAPFKIQLLNEDLHIYRGEGVELKIKVEGSQLPEKVFLNREGIEYQMNREDDNIFSIQLNQIRNNTEFYLDAAGHRSQTYELLVSNRPVIRDFIIEVQYPNYLHIKNDKFNNVSSLSVPEGSTLKWLVSSYHTESVFIEMNDSVQQLENINQNSYQYSLLPKQDFNYLFKLNNEKGKIERSNEYSIEVVKDKYPQVNVNYFIDSTLLSTIGITGIIEDDHGFKDLTLYYSTNSGLNYQKTPISINKSIRNQEYAYLWNIEALKLDAEETLEFYLLVRDNDELHSFKTAKSQLIQFRFPSQNEIKKIIESNRKKVDNQISSSKDEANNVNKKLEDILNKLKLKQKLDFEDKELIKETLEKSEKIEDELKEIQKQLEENIQQEESLNKNKKEELIQKNKDLLELSKDIQDQEKEELLNKIRDLMNKTDKSEDLSESINKLQKKEQNRLQELNRLLQLYKRLQLEYSLSEISKDLEKLSDNQDIKDSLSNNEEQKLQESLNEDFEKIKERMDSTYKENQKLESPISLKDNKELKNEIDQSQNKASEQLKQNNKQGAKKSQKEASDKMKKLAESLQSMASGMQGEQIQEDIDQLRAIVDDLLKLSYRQEDILVKLKDINSSDPQFLALSEKQLNIKDDSRVIKDSLISIANRVFQLKNAITTEVNTLEDHIDEAIKLLQVRDDNKAVAYQQMSMESINNLSLLLDDIIQQMQMQMSSSGAGGKSSNQQEASPSEIQKSINQKTQQLSQQQKQGREYSESLAELAQEQARLRKQLEESMKDKGQQEGEDGTKGSGGNLSELIKEMDEIEEDIVNKRINKRLIEKQNKILTRLLESEKSNQQQEESEERKAETAKDYKKDRVPAAFKKYLEERQKEIEQLQYTAPNLSPFYKNELNKYYNRLNKTPSTN